MESFCYDSFYVFLGWMGLLDSSVLFVFDDVFAFLGCGVKWEDFNAEFCVFRGFCTVYGVDSSTF